MNALMLSFLPSWGIVYRMEVKDLCKLEDAVSCRETPLSLSSSLAVPYRILGFGHRGPNVSCFPHSIGLSRFPHRLKLSLVPSVNFLCPAASCFHQVDFTSFFELRTKPVIHFIVSYHSVSHLSAYVSSSSRSVSSRRTVCLTQPVSQALSM